MLRKRRRERERRGGGGGARGKGRVRKRATRGTPREVTPRGVPERDARSEGTGRERRRRRRAVAVRTTGLATKRLALARSNDRPIDVFDRAPRRRTDGGLGRRARPRRAGRRAGLGRARAFRRGAAGGGTRRGPRARAADPGEGARPGRRRCGRSAAPDGASGRANSQISSPPVASSSRARRGAGPGEREADGHARRWRTGSTSRRRARAPCTPGRSWPNGSSPARTRRSPSSRSGVTRAISPMRAPVCERRWTPVRGPGRGSRDSFVRSVAVRPNAEGGGLARRPGARVRDWVGDGADVWRYQFGSQCVGQRADEGGRLRGSEPFLANHELKNFRVRRHTYIPTEIRLHFFRGGTNVPTHLDSSPWRRVDFSEQPRPATSTLSMR